MKIQCDVCNRDEASVFCSADEAALCDGCDRRVHHANKLASKHHRFSLLHPSSSSSKDAPRCDICQEKRAFLFCREDRAILCRDCDLSIHTVNELTQKHNRFLLTGVKLSSTSAIFNSSSSSSTTTTTIASSSDVAPDIASVDSKTTLMNNINSHPATTKKARPSYVSPAPGLNNYPPPSSTIQTNTTSSTPSSKGCDHYIVDQTISVGGLTSSISEYLMETLPGWQVEDLLDSSSSHITHDHYNGFCKNEDLLPFLDANHLDQTSNLGCIVSEDLSLWVPEAPIPPNPPPIDNRKNGLMFKEVNNINNPIKSSKVTNRRRSDHGFTVPQISPPSNKRSRPLW